MRYGDHVFIRCYTKYIQYSWKSIVCTLAATPCDLILYIWVWIFAFLKEWRQLFQKANTAIQNRELKLEETANLIETNLQLLGATAVEDKLQEMVFSSPYMETYNILLLSVHIFLTLVLQIMLRYQRQSLPC